MCGIAGALLYNPEVASLNRFFEAVTASTARGKDSFGMVRWSRSTGWKEIRHLGDGDLAWAEVFTPIPSAEPSFYLHTSRAEPTTEWCKEKTRDDIPPFRDHNIAVAHNGIISNDADIESRFAISRRSKVDTAVLPGLISELGIWRAIGEIKGGAALGIIDAEQERLYLCRNFMPLTITWEPGLVCFASEACFFYGAGEPFTPFQIWDLPPFMCIEIASNGYRYPIQWGVLPAYDEGEGWRSYPHLQWG